jgi:hypothetical protein
VAVARLQRRPHGLLHLLGLRPPRAQAHRGHLQDAVDGCQFDVLHGSAGWGRARASTETLQLDCDAIYTELRSSVRTNLTLILDRRFFERFVYVFVLSGVGMLPGLGIYRSGRRRKLPDRRHTGLQFYGAIGHRFGSLAAARRPTDPPPAATPHERSQSRITLPSPSNAEIFLKYSLFLPVIPPFHFPPSNLGR